MSKMSTKSQPVKTSSGPIRLVYTFLIVSLPEMSLLCFSTTLLEKSVYGVENKINMGAPEVLLVKVED